MKGALVVVGVLAVLGYMWYAGMLPFGSDSSNALSPTVENIQQVSNVIPSNENRIVYYSFENIPDVPDKQIPINALNKAIETWETNNPDLEFIQSENSNIEIRWQKFASPTHTGLATCNTVLFGILSHCVLDISIGDEDCNGNFVQNDENMVTNILMHEIGHALGLGHTSEEGHLMYSDENPEINFNAKGFVVPDRFEELYVGQHALLKQEKELRAELGKLDVKISREQSQYDEYYKQYEYYEGKTLSQKEYQKAERALNLVNTQAAKMNAMIDQQNELIEQINEIIVELGCNPNFEIVS